MISDYMKHTVSVAWLWQQKCISSVVCETMTGNPCGDFGIQLDYRSQDQSICHAGHKYHGSLEFNDVLSISVWHTANAKFQASCFLWCTEDGKMPENVQQTPVDEALITAIVSKYSTKLFF